MSEMDLNHHYRVLKQFLDISDDLGSRNKSNSTRAARAREKLLKLSAAQFKELSTDVYDELRRRIDESRGEPDYLLPKSSFHPKRNQARQKLSSLPQTRFKDLVSDILFEIERRDLHTEKVTTIPDTDNGSVDKTRDSYEQASQVVQATTEPTVTSNASSPTKDFDAARKDSAASQNQTIGIQSKTVVPTKANLTWSSDEEEEDEVAEEQKPVTKDIQNTTDETHHSRNNSHLDQLKAEHSQKDELISQLNSRISVIERENFSLEEKYRLLQDDYEFSITQNKTLSQELEKLSEEKNNRSVSDNEHSKQIEQLKSTISTLEAENQSLKSATPNGSAKSVNGALSPNSDKGHRSENVKKDMAVFFDRLSRLESAPLQQQGSYVELKNDLIKWQKKYEEARSKTLSTDITQAVMSHEQLKSFVSSYGLISIKLVADLQALVESFILYLNGKSFETDVLFEKISKISILANEIATQGEYNQPFNSNEHSICLREAVSYALSATRYYVVYSSILPKIVVERSVGEICFTLCDLITVTKLQENSSDLRSVQPAANAVKPSLTSGLEQDFGARPLKMANRLRESSLSSSNSPALQDEQSSPFNTPDLENSGHSRNLFGGNAPASGFLRKISPFGGVRLTSAPKDPNPETKSTPKSNGSSTDLNEVYPAREVSLVQPATTEVPSSSSSLPTKKAESPKSRNISALASKFEQASSDVDLNKSNKSSPRSISPGIKQLTSKLDSKNEMSTSQTSSPTQSPYKKKNILDKVRHFEAEQESQAPSHSRQSSSSLIGRKSSVGDELEKDSEPSIKSLDAKSTLNEPFEAVSTIPQTTPEHDSTKNIDNVNGLVNKKIRNNSGGSVDSGRGKGLFQSIRDRLTSDNDHKIPDESTYSEEGNSDNEKVELSTDKLITSTAETTPSKDLEDEGDENASDFSPVKANDRGFFQSIKDRLTTNTLEEDLNQKSISSASSDTTVHIDSKNSLDSGSSNGIGSRKLSNEVVPGVRSLPFDAHQPGLAINYLVPGQGKENGARSMSNESGGSLKSAESAKSNNSGRTEALKSSLATEKAQVVKKVNYLSDTKTNNIDDKAIESSEEGEEDEEEEDSEEEETDDEDEDSEETQARQRQEYRKSMAAATFNIDLFDIDDPDNTLTQVLLYLEHQTVQVITTIQSLLSAIKKPNATRGDLREKSQAITVVISQMTEATNTSMNQTRNAQLKEHGSWVVKSLEDCNHRMNILCKPNSDKNDSDFADKNFKQRLAGISFDIAKCTKELVKTVEEASLKEDIANLDARLEHADDLT